MRSLCSAVRYQIDVLKSSEAWDCIWHSRSKEAILLQGRFNTGGKLKWLILWKVLIRLKGTLQLSYAIISWHTVAQVFLFKLQQAGFQVKQYTRTNVDGCAFTCSFKFSGLNVDVQGSFKYCTIMENYLKSSLKHLCDTKNKNKMSSKWSLWWKPYFGFSK